jgi:Fic family protein
VRFLAIHPFQDGNGRLARALTTLLLLRAGYAYVPYSSLERIVEDNKDDYYRALRRAQSTLDTDESQLADWLTFFLCCLVVQKDVLARKIEREQVMAALPPLDEQLLALVRDHGRLTLAEAERLTGKNRNTLKLHFRQLLATDRLILRGKGRASWYEIR